MRLYDWYVRSAQFGHHPFLLLTHSSKIKTTNVQMQKYFCYLNKRSFLVARCLSSYGGIVWDRHYLTAQTKNRIWWVRTWWFSDLSKTVWFRCLIICTWKCFWAEIGLFINYLGHWSSDFSDIYCGWQYCRPLMLFKLFQPSQELGH